MHIIEELAAYFSQLLTWEQKEAVAKICGLPPQDEEEFDEPAYEDYDDCDCDCDWVYNEWSEFDDVYDLPPDRKKGHAAGKRRPLRRPVLTAAALVGIFRETAERQWKETPVSLEILIALARVRDPERLQGVTRAKNWRRFLAAVACLKDLDEDALACDIRLLLEERKRAGTADVLFRDWFLSWRAGRFARLADSFCRRKIEGTASRAVLRALRSITWPESDAPAGEVSSYRAFLENPELVAVFDYYRILRKLEYLLKSSADEAVRRAVRKYS